ncbi:MAG: hypothetical protein FJ224_05675 [Lentisphaerae bacterium]|nr:hypothetical protein [Lentisphaerota bacterium]
MKKIVLSVLLLLVAGAVAAGESLTVRLVRARQGKSDGPSPGLEDVAPALERNLAYGNFRVVASATLPLPADGSQRRIGAYDVVCSGPQDDLAIEVTAGGRPVIRTRVVLRDGKPLIVGGLGSAEGGRMMFVFESVAGRSRR